MHDTADITLDRGWLMVLRDLGINPEDVVRHARLPLQMLHQETSHLTVDDYFRMVTALETVAADPLLAIRMGQTTNAETFSAPVFAALCSSTLAVAVRRIAAHKRLMAPMHLTIRESAYDLVVAWAWNDPAIVSPRLLMAMDLVFLTQLARIATRENIQPVTVTCPAALEPALAYRDYFGVEPVVGPELSLTFRAHDAHRPFLTASESLWSSFEPELQRRTTQLDARAPMRARVRSLLLECLPSGEATLSGVALRLGVSARTVQRRLADEDGVSFREVVQSTRAPLARHYLVRTSLPFREIAFLLGFDEPTSFSRAFRTWFGETPESVRARAHSTRPA
ncbi:MAG: AraC family transcriptional regulator [Microbacteriaceae bacterium]|nr:AraC family transcriptional regulator [Microbacteriaceae bacterium]